MAKSFLKSMFALALISAVLSPPALAEEEVALYDAPPPADAAFVRFLGIDGTSTYGPYKVPAERVSEGNYSAFHAGEVAGRAVGEFVTVVPGVDGALVEILEPAKSEAKVTIGLINLDAGPASLKTPDGKIEIISGTAQFGAGWREVNPIQVPVQVFTGETAVGDPVTLTLRRGAHPTFVVSNGTVTQTTSQVLSGVLE